MARFIINGANRLSGTYRPLGNKNAVLPMCAAALLTDEPLILHNIPLIKDVRIMLELLESMNVSVRLNGHTVELCAAGLNTTKLPKKLCNRVRTSILLAGPLVARHGEASIHPPGGDVIGRRRLDTHFYGLRKLGATVEGNNPYTFKGKQLRGNNLLLDEASVTATEQILMAAVLAEGKTTIFNTACEPHVQDLCCLLTDMGAKISGIGTNLLAINGVRELSGATYTVGPDHIETASFMAAVAITGGELCVKNPPDHISMRVLQKGFHKLNLRWTHTEQELLLKSTSNPVIQKDHNNAIPKIEDGIWPSFPSDALSIAIVLATQTQGTALFFEKLFESRLYFIDHLLGMGANIVQCDPHRVVVSGPSPLHGSQVSSPDIRAGMTMVIAALCAQGQSIIDNAQMVDRGYEAIDERLRNLGADIVRE